MAPSLKWRSMKSMKHKRVFTSLCERDGQLYVVGGCDASGQPIETVESYDFKCESWKSLPSMSVKRAAPSVQIVQDHIVAVGGVSITQQPLDVVESYSLKEKRWKLCHPLGESLLGITSVVYDGSMYIVGGMKSDTCPSASFLRYDAVSDHWTAMPNMLTARYATYCFIIGSLLYVIGGRVGKYAVDAFEVFDFNTSKWCHLDAIPSKRIFASYVATSRVIYSVGGLHSDTGFVNSLQMFSLDTQKWSTKSPMLTKRGDFIAVRVKGDNILVVGGLGNQGKPLTDCEYYDAELDVWQRAERPSQGHASASFHTDTSGAVYIVGGLNDRGPSACLDLLKIGGDT